MFRKQTENAKLNELIEVLLTDLNNDHAIAHTDEYASAVDQVVKLHALKTTQSRGRVSPDVMATSAANILSILAIVAYEQKNLLASKAMTFVRRM